MTPYQYNILEMRKQREQFLIFNLNEIPKEPGEAYGYVYSITNLKNGMMYIGSTTNYFERGSSYIRKYRNPNNMTYDRYIHQVIRQVGIEHFRMQALCQCASEKSLRETEALYMKDFNTYYPSGYNTHDAAFAMIHTAETKRKKSRPIIAVNVDEKVVYFADSSALLARHVFNNVDRSVIVQHARHGKRHKNFLFFYFDRATAKVFLDKKISQYNKLSQKMKEEYLPETGRLYIEIGTAFLNEGPGFFKRNEFKMYRLKYSDNPDGSEYSVDEIK